MCTSLHTDNQASTSPLNFLWDGCSSWCPNNTVKALKPNSQCYICYSFINTELTNSGAIVNILGTGFRKVWHGWITVNINQGNGTVWQITQYFLLVFHFSYVFGYGYNLLPILPRNATRKYGMCNCNSVHHTRALCENFSIYHATFFKSVSIMEWEICRHQMHQQHTLLHCN